MPWLRILSSPAVIVSALSTFSDLSVGFLLSIHLPTYLKDVLYFDLKSNGLLSALPPLCLWLSKNLTASLADLIRRKTSIAPDKLCKAFNSIAAFGSAGCLLGLGFLDCRMPWLAVLCLMLSGVFRSGYMPGYSLAILSVAPQFTGTISSICRLVGQTSAMMVWLCVSKGFIIPSFSATN